MSKKDLKKFMVIVPRFKRDDNSTTYYSRWETINEELDTETRLAAGLIAYTGSNGLPSKQNIKTIINKMNLTQQYNDDVLIYRGEASEFDELYVMLSLYVRDAMIFDYEDIVNFGLAMEGIINSCAGVKGRYNSQMERRNDNVDKRIDEVDPVYFKRVSQWEFPTNLVPVNEYD